MIEEHKRNRISLLLRVYQKKLVTSNQVLRLLINTWLLKSGETRTFNFTSCRPAKKKTFFSFNWRNIKIAQEALWNERLQFGLHYVVDPLIKQRDSNSAHRTVSRLQSSGTQTLDWRKGSHFPCSTRTKWLNSESTDFHNSDLLSTGSALSTSPPSSESLDG